VAVVVYERTTSTLKDPYDRIAEIYHSARELHGADRARFLQEACGSDAKLLQQIQTLLQQDESANGLLDQPAIRIAAELMSESKAVAWAPGTQVGPYELLSRVGTGGMGEVYSARDTRLGRTVALKLVHAHLLVDAQIRQRFRSEARAVAGLSHRNIVALFDIGEFHGNDFLVMEYVNGRTLKDMLTVDGLPFIDVIHYGMQIANALSAAHAAGIVHRDIKPANIMITPESEVKVLDFGLAKPAPPAVAAGDREMDARQQPTAPGIILGTVSYMSPEQTRGMVLDARSDIFSLGCVLYEAATGRPPFQGPTTLAIMHEIVSVDPLPPSTLNGNLSAGFDQVIQRALAKDKKDRYSSARAFADDLAALHTDTKSASSWQSSALSLRWIVVLLIASLGLVSAWTLRSRFRTTDAAMVAVLPFEDLSANSPERYVSQGVTEDVIAQLGRAGASGFGVIGGTSVWRYRDIRVHIN
jgi:serine/threonine protein kinase